MRWLDLIFAARPMLHLPIWSVYLVALHYHNALSQERFDSADFLILLGLSLLAAGAYYINQIFDQETDRANNKVGFLSNGIVTQRQLMVGFLVSSLAALVIGWGLGGLTPAIFLQIFVLGFFYSAPPVRLKDRALWGLIANFWGIGFLVAFAVMPNINFNNAGLLGWDNPFYFGFAIGGTYVLTTIPDLAGDELAGKRTLAVVLGRSGAMILGTVLHLVASYIAFRKGFHLLAALALFSAVIAAAALFISRPSWLGLAIKIPILLLTLLAGIFYPAYLLFNLVLVVLTRIYYRRRFGLPYPSLSK